MKTTIKTYSELIKLPTFMERYEYLKIGGGVGIETFGFDRYLNQAFYNSTLWRKVRQKVLIRDNGCDLGIEDRAIFGTIIVHHINPVQEEDLENRELWILDPEFLISTSINTHNAIHYGSEKMLFNGITERRENDTCPWR